MTQEDKELLLRDLCARLPYGVKVKTNNINILKLGTHTRVGEYVTDVIEPCKPYLFPMSSMTEEQRKEYESLCIKETSERADFYGIIFSQDYYYDTVESIDFLYKNHIDIRLIPKGLAIDCTNLNIY